MCIISIKHSFGNVTRLFAPVDETALLAWVIRASTDCGISVLMEVRDHLSTPSHFIKHNLLRRQ